MIFFLENDDVTENQELKIDCRQEKNQHRS